MKPHDAQQKSLDQSVILCRETAVPTRSLDELFEVACDGSRGWGDRKAAAAELLPHHKASPRSDDFTRRLTGCQPSHQKFLEKQWNPLRLSWALDHSSVVGHSSTLHDSIVDSSITLNGSSIMDVSASFAFAGTASTSDAHHGVT